MDNNQSRQNVRNYSVIKVLLVVWVLLPLIVIALFIGAIALGLNPLFFLKPSHEELLAMQEEAKPINTEMQNYFVASMTSLSKSGWNYNTLRPMLSLEMQTSVNPQKWDAIGSKLYHIGPIVDMTSCETGLTSNAFENMEEANITDSMGVVTTLHDIYKATRDTKWNHGDAKCDVKTTRGSGTISAKLTLYGGTWLYDDIDFKLQTNNRH